MKRGSGGRENKAVNQKNNRYFLIVSQRLRSKAQINTPTPPHNPAGRCRLAGFSVNAELHPVRCGLSALRVCSSAPPSVKQTHRPAALYSSMTQRQRAEGSRAERRRQQCNLVATLRVPTSHPVRCYWLGVTIHCPDAQKCPEHSKIITK